MPLNVPVSRAIQIAVRFNPRNNQQVETLYLGSNLGQDHVSEQLSAITYDSTPNDIRSLINGLDGYNNGENLMYFGINDVYNLYDSSYVNTPFRDLNIIHQGYDEVIPLTMFHNDNEYNDYIERIRIARQATDGGGAGVGDKYKKNRRVTKQKVTKRKVTKRKFRRSKSRKRRNIRKRSNSRKRSKRRSRRY